MICNRDGNKKTQTKKKIKISKVTGRETQQQKEDRETERQRDRETERLRDRETYIHQTKRQTDRQRVVN